MNIVIRKLLQIKFEYRSIAAREPKLALLHQPNIWWQQYKILRYYRQYGGKVKECVVGPHTDFVVDGFQGSGNSFASAAFKRSQNRPVMVAHHLHSPAQIIKAVRMDLPTLVTIREPSGAVLSLVSRWPYVSISQALRSYVRFYETIEPYVYGFVLSPFDQTTNHVDRVIEEVNHRFHKNFCLFEPTEQNLRALRNPAKLNSAAERRRKSLKAEIAGELEMDAYRSLRNRAEQVYRRLERHGVGS